MSQAWLQGQNPDDLAISDWTEAEFSAALSIKSRIGTMRASERASVLAEFALLSARTFFILEITKAAFQRAARLCERVESGLRASDALHLAIAEQHGAAICSLDRRLNAAAEAVGVKAIRPA